jgi:type II secretory pathway pseudopilin PulG
VRVISGHWMRPRVYRCWVAPASRGLVSVSHRNNLACPRHPLAGHGKRKFAMARTPSPARETRALPRPTDCIAFTIIEVIIVMAIILVLAGLILATSGYVQNKGRRSRAEAEIAAISAALENYKADNGIYPRDTTTDALDARAPTASAYAPASLYLYNQLAGASAGSRTSTAGVKSYFTFKPNQLTPSDQTQNVTFIRDPYGDSYGYSTAYQAAPATGYNPTFDLWSTANAPADQTHWIKNW